MNFLPVTVGSGGTELRLGASGPRVVTLPAAIGLAQGEAMELGVRPTDISLGEAGGIEAEVALIERLGRQPRPRPGGRARPADDH